MIVPPAIVGAMRLGSGRGVEKMPGAHARLSPAVDLVDDERTERDPDHRADQEADPRRAERPADERAERHRGRERPQEKSRGSGE